MYNLGENEGKRKKKGKIENREEEKRGMLYTN